MNENSEGRLLQALDADAMAALEKFDLTGKCRDRSILTPQEFGTQAPVVKPCVICVVDFWVFQNQKRGINTHFGRYCE